MNKRFLLRLIEEWEQYGKIIIAVDFDDTISPFRYDDDEAKFLYNRVWSLLQISHQTGAFIVCHTSCNPDRYTEIEDLFAKNGIDKVFINETPIDLPYGNKGSKVYANIFLDDRAGLNEALEILETALWQQRSKLQSNRLNYEGSIGF